MSRNIVLIGMMGAGKSTVGRVLAERTGRELVETDVEVERSAGRPIAAIFAADGEDTFRRLERDAVASAAAHDGRVVSVGGGAVLDQSNVAALRDTGVLVWLRVPAGTLIERLRRTDHAERPLLDVADPDDPRGVAPRTDGPETETPAADELDAAARIRRLAAARAPRYAETADHTVEAMDSPEAVADEILAWTATRADVLSGDERRRLRAAGG